MGDQPNAAASNVGAKTVKAIKGKYKVLNAHPNNPILDNSLVEMATNKVAIPAEVYRELQDLKEQEYGQIDASGLSLTEKAEAKLSWNHTVFHSLRSEFDALNNMNFNEGMYNDVDLDVSADVMHYSGKAEGLAKVGQTLTSLKGGVSGGAVTAAKGAANRSATEVAKGTAEMGYNVAGTLEKLPPSSVPEAVFAGAGFAAGEVEGITAGQIVNAAENDPETVRSKNEEDRKALLDAYEVTGKTPSKPVQEALSTPTPKTKTPQTFKAPTSIYSNKTVASDILYADTEGDPAVDAEAKEGIFSDTINIKSVRLRPSNKPALDVFVEQTGMRKADALRLNGFETEQQFNAHAAKDKRFFAHDSGKAAKQAMGQLEKAGIAADPERVKELAVNMAELDPKKTRGKWAPRIVEQATREVEAAKEIGLTHRESLELDALIKEVTATTEPYNPDDDPMMSSDYDWAAVGQNMVNANTPQAAVPNAAALAAPSNVVAASAPAPKTGDLVNHTIAWGETLSGIAKQHGTTVEAIAAINGIRNPNKVYAGQSISIPHERDFVVESDFTAVDTDQAVEKLAAGQLENLSETEIKAAMGSKALNTPSDPSYGPANTNLGAWFSAQEAKKQSSQPQVSLARSTPVNAPEDIRGMMTLPGGQTARADWAKDLLSTEQKKRNEAARKAYDDEQEAKRKADEKAQKAAQKKDVAALQAEKEEKQALLDRVSKRQQDAIDSQKQADQNVEEQRVKDDIKAAKARIAEDDKRVAAQPPAMKEQTGGKALDLTDEAKLTADLMGWNDAQGTTGTLSPEDAATRNAQDRATISRAKTDREFRDEIQAEVDAKYGKYSGRTAEKARMAARQGNYSAWGGSNGIGKAALADQNLRDAMHAFAAAHPEHRSSVGIGGLSGPGQDAFAAAQKAGTLTGNQKVKDSDSGKSSGSRVICTELVRQKLMDAKLQRQDMAFTFARLSPTHVKGYHAWAIPYVRLMRRSGLIGVLATVAIEPFARVRAEEVAYQLTGKGSPNLFGKLVRAIGEPLCWIIGRVVEMNDGCCTPHLRHA